MCLLGFETVRASVMEMLWISLAMVDTGKRGKRRKSGAAERAQKGTAGQKVRSCGVKGGWWRYGVWSVECVRVVVKDRK